jgi:ubiquinone/menaquinone biosynthesis C-methylase UbiE
VKQNNAFVLEIFHALSCVFKKTYVTINIEVIYVPIYQGLAAIYDKLMEGVNYREWAQYIRILTEKYGHETGNVLDLACGTGSTSITLAKQGWRVTGVDLSQPMLQQARKKAAQAKQDIIFLQQDMRDLTLTREFDLVTCFQDGLNYLLTKEDLAKTFGNIYKAVRMDGLFIFDLNLVEKYSFSAQGEISFIDKEDFSLVYETFYHPEEKIWEIKVTGFIRDDQHYVKFQELHREKHHNLEEVKDTLGVAGFKVLDVFHAFSQAPPSGHSRRIFIIAQKVEGRE